VANHRQFPVILVPVKKLKQQQTGGSWQVDLDVGHVRNGQFMHEDTEFKLFYN
jgi:hypothetical protein